MIIFAHIGKYSVHLWNSDKKKKKKSFTKTHYLAGEWKRDRKKTTSKHFLSADFQSDDRCSEPESELNWRGGKCRLYFSHLHLLLLRAISEQKRKSEKRREKRNAIMINYLAFVCAYRSASVWVCLSNSH